LSCELHETLETAVETCRRIDSSRPRHVLSCGLKWYAELVKEVLASQRFPTAQMDFAIANHHNFLFNAGWTTLEIVPSQHLPPDKIFIGTEDEYLHALADQEARRILLEDPT
jgi:hypothetical protein